MPRARTEARVARMRGMGRDRSGAAAVEFALTAPLLVLIMMGMGDLAPTIAAKFKVGNATQSIADLTTQFANMQTSDMANVFAGGADVMSPFSTATLAIRITSVATDGNGSAFVNWSCGQGVLGALAARSSVTTTPTGSSVTQLLKTTQSQSNGYTTNGANTSYVMVETSYTYTPPTQFVVQQPQVMYTVAYMMPRVSAYVGFPWDGNPNDSVTVPTAATHTASVTLGNGAVCNYSY